MTSPFILKKRKRRRKKCHAKNHHRGHRPWEHLETLERKECRIKWGTGFSQWTCTYMETYKFLWSEIFAL